MSRNIQVVDQVVIRFAGDSGDGMQVTGDQFTDTTATQGNDLATFPDYPAEIRAPAGTLAGVSGFQLHFSSHRIHTAGDAPEVLIAMNPAALKVNVPDLRANGMIIVNTDKFTDKDMEKAEYKSNPLEDGSLDAYQVIPVPLTTLTKRAVEGLGLGTKEADRCKNFFALGIAYWLYNRDMSHTQKWVKSKFKAPYDEANLRALDAGFSYADTLELFKNSYEVPAAKLTPGRYRNITGNAGLALGLVAASKLAGKQLFLGSYPITPASDVLHYLSGYKDFGVITFQAEDEIAAVTSSIGAAFGGAIAATTTSGPGFALKSEGMSLALMTELPLVVINIQRAGPSTGLPTKTEQADLMTAMYGRHGESPLPILAAKSPVDCFHTAVEAVRIALKYMTPVILLTDGSLANGSEPWRLPDLEDLPKIEVNYATDPETYQPYLRNPETLARPWAVPGTPGLEHRIGGIEKQAVTGNVSYHPANHEFMCRTRAERVARIADEIGPAEVYGATKGTLVLTWGGTFGASRSAVDLAIKGGIEVGHCHLRWLNPFPSDLGEVLRRYDHVLVPELNLGQLVKLIRAEFLVDAISYPKIMGQPFKVAEILARIQRLTMSAA